MQCRSRSRHPAIHPSRRTKQCQTWIASQPLNGGNDFSRCADQTKPEWWSLTGSNRRHPACKAGALPAELRPQSRCSQGRKASRKADRPPRPMARAKATDVAARRLSATRMVGLGRLERPTSRLSSARSNQLSYKPGPRAEGCHPDRFGARALTIDERPCPLACPRKKEKRRRRQMPRMMGPVDTEPVI